MKGMVHRLMLLTVVIALMMGAAPAQGEEPGKHQVRLNGMNEIQVFQGSRNYVSIYVNVAGNGAENPVELLVQGKREVATGNGTFGFLIDPGSANGPITAQVLGSAMVEGGEAVEVGSVKIVPVPKQLIATVDDYMAYAPLLAPDWSVLFAPNLPTGVAVDITGRYPSDRQSPMIIENGSAMTQRLIISSKTGLQEIRMSVDGKAKLNASVTAKDVASPMYQYMSWKGTYQAKYHCVRLDSPLSGAFLDHGYYNMNLTVKMKNGKIIGPVTLMALERVSDEVSSGVYTEVPNAITLSAGMKYNIARTEVGPRPLDQFSESSNNKVVKVVDGVLYTKKPGTAKVYYHDAWDMGRTCKVTVIPNEYKRSKPLMRAGKQVFTSTKRVYYSGSSLKAEVFVYNRTGRTIKGCEGYVFRLFEDEKLIYERPLGPLRFASPLRSGKSKVYKATITEALLPGVAAREFDLGSGRVRAVVVSANAADAVQPLIKSVPGAVSAKSAGTDMGW